MGKPIACPCPEDSVETPPFPKYCVYTLNKKNPNGLPIEIAFPGSAQPQSLAKGGTDCAYKVVGNRQLSGDN